MQTSGKEIVRNLYLAKSLAISSLVVESCFDSCRRGDFLVDDSGVKGAPFLFRYFFGSFDEFHCPKIQMMPLRKLFTSDEKHCSMSSYRY